MHERPIREWLEAEQVEYLSRVARRVAFTYHLADSDVPDLFQELCLALWKAGPERLVNPTWVFHTANHRAIELLNRKCRSRRFAAAAGAEGLETASELDPERILLVRARVDRLPPALRRFCRLRFQEGYTQNELMEEARLTRGSVRGLERECLRRLRGRLAAFARRSRVPSSEVL